MASAHDLRRAGAVLAVALTAALVWLGTGLHPWWPAVWLAPLPVLVYAPRTAWWRCAIAAAMAWLVGLLSLWHYLHDVLRIPGGFVAQFYGGETLAFTLGVLLARALIRRGAYAWAVIAFPAVRVAFEYLLATGGPHGTAGSLGRVPAGAAAGVDHRPVRDQLPGPAGSRGARHRMAAARDAQPCAADRRRAGHGGRGGAGVRRGAPRR
jgi:hypothetical protein